MMTRTASSTEARIRSIEENLTAFHVCLGDWPAVHLHREPDRIWTISERRFSLCNVILDARFGSSDVDLEIRRALAPYERARVNVMWKLGPSTQPHDLGDHLARHRFVARPTLRGMTLDISAAAASVEPPPGFVIQEVTSPANLASWQHALDRGFGWPFAGAEHVATNVGYVLEQRDDRPLAAFVALENDVPVASSLVFFGAGVAGIYHVSTAPEYRGRGLGTAMTSAALAKARRRGCGLAILHATEKGGSVYRRLGFEEVCTIGLRLRMAASAS
jgi:GNAT superfamily N-acetyltransferase